MSDLQSLLSLKWLGLVFGVTIGQYLVVEIRLAEHAREYIWAAARQLWLFLLVTFTVELAIGTLLLSFWPLPTEIVPQTAAAILCGVLVALGLVGTEHLLVTAGPNTRFVRGLFKLLSTLRVALLQKFEGRIQLLMEDDNFAWQEREGDWDFEVPVAVVGRRIRKIYECQKLSIANRRRAPWLLKADINHHPARKFYRLVKEFGPKRLQERLRNEVRPPSEEWDGREQRRVRSEGPQRRSYDDSSLMNRIAKGTGD